MNRNMEAITWALHARGISPTAFRLLIQLCSHVNNMREDFAVWPSHKSIAAAVEISVSGVKRHVQELVEAGLLIVRSGTRKDGGTSSNVYYLAVRKVYTMPDGGQVHIDPGVGDDPPPGVTGEQRWGVTADLCNEPLKERTSERKNIPPHPSGEAPLGAEADLLGDAIEVAKPSLVEHVLGEWAKLVAAHPRIPMPRGANTSRANKIRARAGEVVKLAAARGDAVTPELVWDEIFAAIRASEWLRGDAPVGRGYSKPFAVSLDKILEPAFFLQTLEKAPIDVDHARATSDPATGRRYGPAEEAGRAALARLRAARATGAA